MKRIHEGFKARLAAVMVVAAVGLGLMQVAPAAADTTTVTFAIAPGGLAIDNAQTAVDLGTATNGTLASTVTGSLGNITVSDTRDLSVGWVASGATTDFTRTGGTETISSALATLTQSNTVVSSTGSLTSFLGGTGPGTLAVLGTAVTVGRNTVTFAPTITIAAPVGTATGTYTGTFTSTIT